MSVQLYLCCLDDGSVVSCFITCRCVVLDWQRGHSNKQGDRKTESSHWWAEEQASSWGFRALRYTQVSFVCWSCVSLTLCAFDGWSVIQAFCRKRQLDCWRIVVHRTENYPIIQLLVTKFLLTVQIMYSYIFAGCRILYAFEDFKSKMRSTYETRNPSGQNCD